MQNYKTILVVTYGRTGSTLLQGLLNSIDGYLIRGENHNLFHGFYTAYAALQKTLKLRQEVGGNPTQAWYGARYYDADTFLENLQKTASTLLLANEQARCLGFKEIRYIGMTSDPEALTAYLDFLQLLFKESCIIFNTRNLADTIKSGFWNNSNPDTLTHKLETLENTLFAYGMDRKNFFHIDYADMAGHSTKIEALFEFLGEGYNKDQVEAVLSVKHSTVTAEVQQKKKNSKSTILAVMRRCVRAMMPR